MSCIQYYIGSKSKYCNSVEYGYQVWDAYGEGVSSPSITRATTPLQRLEYAMAASLFAVGFLFSPHIAL